MASCAMHRGCVPMRPQRIFCRAPSASAENRDLVSHALSVALTPVPNGKSTQRIGSRRATPSPYIGGAVRIRGLAFGKSFKLENAWEQSGILLFGQSCGVQLAQRRLSAALRGAKFAPMDVFRSHVSRGQSNPAHDDHHHYHVETHSAHPSSSLHQTLDLRVTRLIARCRFDYRWHFTVANLFSEIARAAAQITDRFSRRRK